MTTHQSNTRRGNTLPDDSGIRPPQGYEDWSLAKLLSYAMKAGLGRKASFNPQRIEWQYDDLVYETQISERSIRSYKNGHGIPNTGHLKALLATLTADELHSSEWEGAFIQAWTRDALGISLSTKSVSTLSPRVASLLETTSMSAEAAPEERRQLVGTSATWSNAQRGAYAPRPKLLDALLVEFEKWLTFTKAEKESANFPTFWIDGRSGDGKSVLLIQLAHEISLRDNFGSVLIANGPDSLPQAVEYISKSSSSCGTIDFVFVDDLHKATSLEAFRNEMSALRNQTPTFIPIVACGPTPELAEFQHHFKNFEITNWRVPQISQDDLQLFGDWFGVQSAEMKLSDRKILVELLFEMSVGEPIERFAASFQSRLAHFGIFETVRSMLSVNAIDVSAPKCLFATTRENQAIRRLADKDQLHFEHVEEPWGSGVRLVHNRIAQRILIEWLTDPLRGSTRIENYAAEVAHILELECVDGHFAYYFMRAARSRLGEIAERSDWSDVDGLVELIEHIIANPSNADKCKSLAVGTLLALWHAGETDHVSESAVNCAKDLLRSGNISISTRAQLFSNMVILEHRGLISGTEFTDDLEKYVFGNEGSAYGAALVHLTRFDVISKEAVARWILAFPGATIPPELFSFGGSNKIIIDAAITWVEQNPGSLQTGKTIAAIVNSNPSDTSIKEWALDWLMAGLTRSGTSNVVSVLVINFQSDILVKGATFQWIAANVLRTDLHQILAQILRIYPNERETRVLVRDWLKHHEGTASANNVLSVAVKKFSKDKEILLSAIRALNDYGEVASSDSLASAVLFVLNAQWKFLSEADPKLRRSLCMSLKNWMYSENENTGKLQVAAAVVKDFSATRGIKERSIALLHRDKDDKSAFVLVSAVLGSFSNDEMVRERIFDWVENNFFNAGMPNVLCSLIRCAPTRVRGQRIALMWCEDNMTHGGLQQVIAALLPLNPLNDRIKGMVDRLFGLNVGRDLEPTLIGPVIGAYGKDDGVKANLLSWCRRNEETAGVHIAYTAMIARLEGCDEISMFVLNWAGQNFGRRGVDIVLAALIRKDATRAAAKELVISWVGNNLETVSWDRLAVALLESFPNDPSIVARCRRWVEACPDAAKARQLSRKLQVMPR